MFMSRKITIQTDFCILQAYKINDCIKNDDKKINLNAMQYA